MEFPFLFCFFGFTSFFKRISAPDARDNGFGIVGIPLLYVGGFCLAVHLSRSLWVFQLTAAVSSPFGPLPLSAYGNR